MFTYSDTTPNTFTAAADPKVSEVPQGRGQTIPTLDGGTVLAYQFHVVSGTNSVQTPRVITFEWADLAPLALWPFLLNAWRRQLAVTVTWPLVSDMTTTDTLTGYLPAQTPPEYEQTGAQSLRLKFSLQAVKA